MQNRTSPVFLIFLLWLAGLGAAAQFAKIAVPFALIRETYPESGLQVAWLLSLVSLVGALFGTVAGDMVGRLGAKRMLVMGLLLGAIISIWQASLPTFTPMLISRVIEGMSHLAIVVAAPTLIAQLSSQKYLGAAMTLWSTFFSVAFILVAWCVIPLLGSGNLATLFYAHGIYLAVIGAIVAWILPPNERPVTAPAHAVSGILSLHIRGYRSAWISAPAAGWLVYTLTFVSLLALLPEKLPPEISDWAAGLMPLFSIITSLIFVPLLLRHVSGVFVIVAGFASAAAIALINLYLSWDMAFMIILFSLLGLVQGGSFASIPELNTNAKDQALAYGVMAQAGNSGNLLGTPLLLAISAPWGDSGLYLAIAALYLIGSFTHIAIARRRMRAR
jgi:MFS family permease